jgi:hypothetical protein
MKSRFLLFTAIIFAISAVTAISFAQRRPDAADKPITGDFKLTIRNTAGGQSSQGTTMINAAGAGSSDAGKSEARLDFRLIPGGGFITHGSVVCIEQARHRPGEC